ncbi:MAG: hypothetical protein FWG49_05775, partial [Leptospirales bacterium]|nr:hypothetical protein [Leptospirales bacterium]
MSEEVIINTQITEELKEISAFIDYTSINRIINKLTDYAEIITEGRLASLINYNYRLNASQANMIINLLLEIQAVSRIYAIAQKGKRDLDVEFISNIISDSNNPESIPSFLSLRNVIESRMNNQIQQYNMNMNKSNTTVSISVSELHGHIQTFSELVNNNLPAPPKARHGYIMGSLHDAYVINLNKRNWWDDKVYFKYYFNDDEPSKREINLITKDPRYTLVEIGENVKQIVEFFRSISVFRTKKKEPDPVEKPAAKEAEPLKKESYTSSYSAKLLATPFGTQYG